MYVSIIQSPSFSYEHKKIILFKMFKWLISSIAVHGVAESDTIDQLNWTELISIIDDGDISNYPSLSAYSMPGAKPKDEYMLSQLSLSTTL